MKEISVKEMLKEMEEYGWDENKIRTWYEDSDKEVDFEEYVKFMYMSDIYINE